MRTLLLFAFLLTPFGIEARQITCEEAKAVALDFFNETAEKENVKHRVLRVHFPKKASHTEDASYYVFNSMDNKGFVIISGDNRVDKIIGYSINGIFDFDNMPPQLAALLERCNERIKSIPSNAPIDKSWIETDAENVDRSGKLLETAQWNQFVPFNSKCPLVDGQRPPTGCVATAMATVLKYQEWPAKGRYERTTADGHYYNFANGSWDWNAIDVGKDEEALADVMYACGVALEMSYGLQESGAYAYYLGHALRYYFKMSPTCQYVTQGNFSHEEWVGMMKGQIDNDMPFIFNALEDRHAWVVDGYDNNGLFHCNWGWGGADNGYFSLDVYGDDFEGVCINIVPDTTNKEYSPAYMDYGYGSTWGKEIGIVVNVKDIAKGVPFRLKASPIVFRDAFMGDIGVALVDADGVIKEIIYSEYINYAGLLYDNLFAENIQITQEVDDTDRLQLVTRSYDSDEWLTVLGSIEAPSSIPCKGNAVKECVLNITVGEGVTFRIDGAQYSVGTHSVNVLCGDFLTFDFDRPSDEERLKESVVVLVNGERNVYDFFYRPYNSTVLSRAYAGGMFVVPDEPSSIDVEVYKYKLIEDYAVTNATPGKLSSIITEPVAACVKKLTVAGDVNATDLFYIRNKCLNLEELDLGDASIDEEIVSDELMQYIRKYGIEPADTFYKDRLPDAVFYNCMTITSLKLPKNLTAIGELSVCNTNINAIDIPHGVKSIGLNAFDASCNLWRVTVHAAPIDDVAHCGFSQGPSYEYGVLFVPKEYLEQYEQHRVWSLFRQIVAYGEDEEFITNVSEIEYDGVKYQTRGKQLYISEITDLAPEALNIPDTIVYENVSFDVVGVNFAVMKTDRVKELTLCDSIRSLSVASFMGAVGLKKVVVGQNVKELPQDVFNGAESLEYIILPDGLETIDWHAFKGCDSLKELRIPKSLYRLAPNLSLGWNITEDEAVNGLSSLKRYEVDEENQSFAVQDGCLYTKNLDALIAVPGMYEGDFETPANVTRLHRGFARNCKHLTSITIGESISSLPNESFCDAKRLRKIIVETPRIDFGRFLFTGSNVRYIVLKENVREVSVALEPVDERYYPLNVIVESSENLDFSKVFCLANNLFSSTLTPSFAANGQNIYLPGGASDDNIRGNSNIDVLYDFAIDKVNNIIEVVPRYDKAAIVGVYVNGAKIDSPDGRYYFYSPVDDMNISIEYSINNEVASVVDYPGDFISRYPSTDLASGVDTLSCEADAAMDVYTPFGVLVKSDIRSEDLSRLEKGLYIVRQGLGVQKIIIR